MVMKVEDPVYASKELSNEIHMKNMDRLVDKGREGMDKSL